MVLNLAFSTLNLGEFDHDHYLDYVEETFLLKQAGVAQVIG
jgi:hypothetical protein